MTQQLPPLAQQVRQATTRFSYCRVAQSLSNTLDAFDRNSSFNWWTIVFETLYFSTISKTVI